jgi:hypothetical protein
VPSYAVQYAEVTGHLKKNGVSWDPLPELQFVLRDGVPDDNRLGLSALSLGGGVYKASLPPGTYDPRLFLSRPTKMVTGVVPDGLRVSGPTQLDIDFQTVIVRGEVSLLGGPFPAAATDRGSVCLLEVEGDQNTFCNSLPGDSAAKYSIEVPRGRSYRVTWTHSGSLENGAPLNELPYGEQLFSTRSFDVDTTLDLNVDTPSLVLNGSVLSEGIPLSEVTPRPTGFVQLGPVALDLTQQGESTFQIRLLAGTYHPIVYVFSESGAIRTLQPCPSAGCAFSKDTEWPLDVVPPPDAVVEGTIDFIDLAGDPVPESALGGGGEIRLEPLPEGETSPPLRIAPNTIVSYVDASHRFRQEHVPFGNYSVSFRGSGPAPGPIGIVRFDGLLVVDREHITWKGEAGTVPAIIDLTVNGRAMPDDSLLEGEPRGELVFSEEGRDDRQGYDGIRLPLGETGPARFERTLLKGRYRVGISARTAVGRTYLRGLNQDVLPIGRLELGTVEVGAVADALGPELLSFDLPVRDVRVRVQQTELLSSKSGTSTLISLRSEESTHPFWTQLSSPDAEASLRVYAGCYRVNALRSEAPYYPDADPHDSEVPVGTLCTCAAP